MRGISESIFSFLFCFGLFVGLFSVRAIFPVVQKLFSFTFCADKSIYCITVSVQIILVPGGSLIFPSLFIILFQIDRKASRLSCNTAAVYRKVNLSFMAS